MIRGGVEPVNRSTAPPAVHRRCDDERAVSEVLGVVMLLAMVITIMGGVWVFLNPYLSDFEDNTNWNSATGLADRIEDRLEVAGNAPEGTGFRNTLAIQSTAIRSVQNVEHWPISAARASTFARSTKPSWVSSLPTKPPAAFELNPLAWWWKRPFPSVIQRSSSPTTPAHRTG